MKNIYISSVLLWNYPIEEIMEITSEYGLAGVEIWAQHAWVQNIDCKNVLDISKELGIKLLCHAASWEINICALNEGIRRQSIEEVKKSILFAKEIGAKNITVHPGYETVSGRSTDWHYKICIESFRDICDFANKNNMIISIELMENVKKQFVTNVEIMNDLLEHLPGNAAATLDIAHLDNNDDFSINMEKLKKISKVHISNRRGSKFHVPLGQGDLDCKSMLRELIKTNLPLVIEGYDENRDLRILKNNLIFLKNL